MAEHYPRNLLGREDGFSDPQCLRFLSNGDLSAVLADAEAAAAVAHAVLQVGDSQRTLLPEGNLPGLPWHTVSVENEEQLDFDTSSNSSSTVAGLACQSLDSLGAPSPSSSNSCLSPNGPVETSIGDFCLADSHGTRAAFAQDCPLPADFAYSWAGGQSAPHLAAQALSFQHPSCWMNYGTVMAPGVPRGSHQLQYHMAARQHPGNVSVNADDAEAAAVRVGLKHRKNMRISKDPQSVAARHRRQRISEKIRVLQSLVPGGSKLDTATMLEEAAHYLKFLKTELDKMEAMQNWMSLSIEKVDGHHVLMDMQGDGASHQSSTPNCSLQINGASRSPSAVCSLLSASQWM